MSNSLSSRQRRSLTHVVVASPVLGIMDIVRGGCPGILTDVSTITDIWEDMLFDAVGAILGLPPTCMESFGLINCLLGSYIVNVEATDSSSQVNTEGASESLKCPESTSSLPPIFSPLLCNPLLCISLPRKDSADAW